MKKLIAMILTASMLTLSLAGCGAKPEEAAPAAASAAEEAEEAASSAEEEAASSAEEVAESISEAVQEAGGDGEGKSVGFVTFGLGGDFFQALADTYVAKMTEAGWDAQYADGAFDPTTQIEAAENFIAMGVDVLIVWSVAPEAMDGVVKSARDAGIKFLAFVAPTSEYDMLMVADDAELADNCNKLAAKWIDEKFADAEDHSVPVAVFTCRTAETGVIQGDELLKIEEYSTKAKLVTEVECASEDMSVGQQNAENLYTTNPEIQVFLTAHSGLGVGINSFYTSASSPVTDYSDRGIFLVNGDTAVAESIKESAEDGSMLRGMVMTGSVDDTANEILDACEGLMDGSVETGFVKKAATVFVNADTVDEYLTTGTVSSVTDADF